MSTETTNTSEEPIPAPAPPLTETEGLAKPSFNTFEPYGIPSIPKNGWDHIKTEDIPFSTPTPPLTEMTPDEDIPAIKLGDMYDHCLLGATVKGRYAYSIKEIVKFEMMNRRIQIDEAEKVVMADIVDLMRQYGAAAPEFIDDSLLDAKIEIIMPQS